MENILVFALGTALSFLPIHWAIKRAAALWDQRSKKPVSNTPPSGRDEFIAFLRREAMSRVMAVLDETLQDVDRLGRYSPQGVGLLDAAGVARLKEARKLLQPLFSRKDVAHFDLIATALTRCELAKMGEIEDEIEGFRSRLANPEAGSESKPSRAAFPDALNPLGRRPLWRADAPKEPTLDRQVAWQ